MKTKVCESSVHTTTEPPFKVLRAIMTDRHLTLTDLGSFAGITAQSVKNKLDGKAPWKLPEMLGIKNGLEFEDKLETLFSIRT